MKKGISILLLVFLISAMFSMTVAAETTTASGFYNIGSVDDVEITPYAANSRVSVTDQDVDNDNVSDKWYVNSDRLEVSYTEATDDGYYGVILVEGSDLPTKDNTIFYIDQVTAESNTIDFNVYPILPEETTDLTLYISSNVEGFKLISIPLNYVVGAEVTVPSYTLGDIDDDGVFGVKDALIVLQIGVDKYPATDAEKAAADVDGDGICGVKDALLILQYGTGKINSFN